MVGGKEVLNRKCTYTALNSIQTPSVCSLMTSRTSSHLIKHVQGMTERPQSAIFHLAKVLGAQSRSGLKKRVMQADPAGEELPDRTAMAGLADR